MEGKSPVVIFLFTGIIVIQISLSYSRGVAVFGGGGGRNAIASENWGVAVINKVESVYPIRTSCSFLAINYSEEISNKFEEYLSEALIPENSCLLNEVCYPLNKIDTFYGSPWTEAEYDEEFMSKEANRVDEIISRICANVFPFNEIDDCINEDSLEKLEVTFETVNFEEEDLTDLKEDQCANGYEFLDVPQIPNSVLLLKKHFTPMADLIKNLGLIELDENIFKEENMISFEDLEKSYEYISLSPEKECLTANNEEFQELILPEIPGEDLNFENISYCDNGKRSSFDAIEKNATDNLNDSMVSNPLRIDCDQEIFLVDYNALDDNSQFNDDISCEDKDWEASGLIHQKCEPEETMSDLKLLNCNSQSQTSQVINFNVELDNFVPLHTEENPSKNHNSIFAKRYNDSFTNLCQNGVSSETYLCLEDVSSALNVDIIKQDLANHCITDVERQNSGSPKSNSGKSFLGKLSSLDFNEYVKTDHFHEISSKKSDVDLVSHSAFRDHASTKQKSVCDIKAKIINQNLCKPQNAKPFNLLSSLLTVKKRESGEKEFLKGSPNFSQSYSNYFSEVTDINVNNLAQVTENKTSSVENISSPVCLKEESTQQIPDEEIITKLPDNYLELVFMHESAAIFYVQKLALWEKFQFSSDLTLLDVSLDKVRFLLKQEIKSCRDRNLSPLKGGVEHSSYMQLLILLGILKSLHCFVYYGAQLSFSTFQDFEKKHINNLKGCCRDLIDEVSNFVQKSSEADLIHPNIKEIGTYLKEKFYFCKKNMISFKALIILKQHLTFFHSAFEDFMKTLLSEIRIELIPQSSVLQQDSSIFREMKDRIYVAATSSLSKDMPWTDITLVVEYEPEGNESWKSMCNQLSIAYVSLKLVSPSLKTLDEIKVLPLAKVPFNENCEKKPKQFLVITSNSVCTKYNLKRLLDGIQNVLLCERSYKIHLPHLHFADIVVDCKTGLVILDVLCFLQEEFLNHLIEKMFCLQLKYEICWIIIENYLAAENLNKSCLSKIQHCFYKFYYMAMILKGVHPFKVKFLYANKSGDVLNYINHILTKSRKRLADNNSYPANSFSINMNKEELFLLSFPSLNPVVVSFILSSKISLYQLMNFDAEELCCKYPYIPERFLKHFHHLMHEKVDQSPILHEGIKDKQFKNSPNASQTPSCSTDSPFQLQLNFDPEECGTFANDFEESCSATENCDTDLLNSESTAGTSFYLDSQSSPTEISTPQSYSKMSLEDIDKCYRDLQLQDIAYSSNIEGDFYSMNSCESDSRFSDVLSNQFTLPSTKRKKYDTVAITDNFNIQQLANNSPIEEIQQFISSKKSTLSSPERFSSDTKCLDMKYPLTSDLGEIRVKQRVSFLYEDDSPDSPPASKKLDFSQYRYSKKRKSPTYPKESKSMKYSVQTSSMLHKSFRVHKGQCSQTVCKETWFKKPPRSQEVKTYDKHSFPPTQGLNQNNVSPFQLTTFKEKDFLENSSFKCSQNLDSSWMSQVNIPLTPRQGHRLSYEKIPGKKGQTRLVFR